MGWKKKVLIGLLILDGVAVNVIAGFLLYKFQDTNSPTSPKASLGAGNLQTVVPNTGEDERFVNIDARMRALEDKIINVTPAPTLRPRSGQTAVPTTRKVRTVQYVTVPGSGSTTNAQWTDVAGSEFYFNPADYPGLVEVYFEANMKLFNGSGMAYVQLFNATSGVGVQGSDVQTNLQTDTVVTSGRVTFWAGRNLIRVQIRSLAADTAVYNSGRLRVVTEN